MKKPLAFLLAVLFVVALFAGCGGQTGTTPTAAPTTGAPASQQPTQTATPSETAQPTEAPVEDNGPYKFAAGKVQLDERGIAQSSYTYDVPFCTTDEVLTYWTTNWTPQIIGEEGFTKMPYPEMVKEMTGVNVEWIIASANNRNEQYSVLLASDDLYDMMGCAFSLHTGTIPQAIDDGYYANLYDYVEYMPNYTYQIKKYDYDKDVLNKIYYDKELIPCFYGILHDPTPRMGYCVRGDFLDKLGMKATDIDTYQEVHDMLVAIKTAGFSEYPMDINKNVEMDFGIIAAGMGTYLYCNGISLPSARVVDGKAVFTLMEEDDRAAMQMISSWYADGLINPNWASVADSTDIEDRIQSDACAYVFFQPSGLSSAVANNANPDCRWDFLVRPRVNSGDSLKIGTKIDKFNFGNTAVSAKCENIPLAVSWCDWFYSEEGSFNASYGPEGLTYTLDQDGNPTLTDFVLHHPDGIASSWVQAAYGINGLCDHGLFYNNRGYDYADGHLAKSMLEGWAEPTGDVAYDWPISCKFTEEETEDIDMLSADLVTYISENWTGFVDGSKPMSEWDSYVAGAYAIGLGDLQAIYQESYNRYLAS